MDKLEQRVLDLENTISTLIKHIQEVNNSIVVGFGKVDNNFDLINDKIDALQGNSTASIETVEGKIDALHGSTKLGFSDLKTEISKINDATGYEGMFKNSLGLKIV